MDLTFFKGMITGLILSLPFGPVGIYCMEKTLVEGQKEGYVSSLGMVTVDVIYGLTALLFINKIDDFIIKYKYFPTCCWFEKNEQKNESKKNRA